MRLHPASHLQVAEYSWYANRVKAMINAKVQDNLYTVEEGWTTAAQDCFHYLETIQTQKIEFRIIRWKGLKHETRDSSAKLSVLGGKETSGGERVRIPSENGLVTGDINVTPAGEAGNFDVLHGADGDATKEVSRDSENG